MSQILILGGTGKTGRLLLPQALHAGHRVTVLVRNPSKLTIQHPALTVVQGDVLRASDVDAVVAGQDAVLSTLGRDGKEIAVLTTGTQHIIAAMQRHSIRRFICMSSLGSGSTSDKLGVVIPRWSPRWDFAGRSSPRGSRKQCSTAARSTSRSCTRGH